MYQLSHLNKPMASFGHSRDSFASIRSLHHWGFGTAGLYKGVLFNADTDVAETWDTSSIIVLSPSGMLKVLPRVFYNRF